MLIRKFLIIFTALALPACSTLSLGSLWALRNTSIETVEVDAARLALVAEQPLLIDRIGVTLEAETEPGDMLGQSFDFDVITSGAEIEALGYAPNAPNIYVLRVPRDQLDMVSNFQG